MSLKTAQELAELYEGVLTSIASGNLQSYSLNGQTYTRHDLAALENIYRYWRNQANAATYGIVALADVRPKYKWEGN